MVPTSLFAQTTAASAVSGRSAAANSSGSMRPSASTPIQDTSKPSVSRRLASSRTAACSTRETTACRFSGRSGPRQTEDGQIIGLGPAAGKHNLLRRSPDQGGHRGAGPFQRRRAPSLRDACSEEGLPRRSAEVRKHRLQNPRIEREWWRHCPDKPDRS